MQGCGKSLCAKAVSSLWQLPLLRFDMGRMFNSLVGSSEENVRKAISVAESVAPAILWVDEIDKAFAGVQGSGGTDGGTTARVFGTFLTWLSEKTSPVFVVATANDITQLPPELLRKGRLDDIFFVDLPVEEERAEIFRIHLTRRGRKPDNFDIKALVAASGNFSGAEIQEAHYQRVVRCVLCPTRSENRGHPGNAAPDRSAIQNHGRTSQPPAQLGRGPGAPRQFSPQRKARARSPPDGVLAPESLAFPYLASLRELSASLRSNPDVTILVRSSGKRR